MNDTKTMINNLMNNISSKYTQVKDNNSPSDSFVDSVSDSDYETMNDYYTNDSKSGQNSNLSEDLYLLPQDYEKLIKDQQREILSNLGRLSGVARDEAMQAIELISEKLQIHYKAQKLGVTKVLDVNTAIEKGHNSFDEKKENTRVDFEKKDVEKVCKKVKVDPIVKEKKVVDVSGSHYAEGIGELSKVINGDGIYSNDEDSVVSLSSNCRDMDYLQAIDLLESMGRGKSKRLKILNSLVSYCYRHEVVSVSQSKLAGFSGCARETVCRAMKQFERLGLVYVKSGVKTCRYGLSSLFWDIDFINNACRIMPACTMLKDIVAYQSSNNMCDYDTVSYSDAISELFGDKKGGNINILKVESMTTQNKSDDSSCWVSDGLCFNPLHCRKTDYSIYNKDIFNKVKGSRLLSDSRDRNKLISSSFPMSLSRYQFVLLYKFSNESIEHASKWVYLLFRKIGSRGGYEKLTESEASIKDVFGYMCQVAYQYSFQNKHYVDYYKEILGLSSLNADSISRSHREVSLNEFARKAQQ